MTPLALVQNTMASHRQQHPAQVLRRPKRLWPGHSLVRLRSLFQIILNIACGITAGALPIMGYNYGARLYSRVKETFKLVVLSTLTVCVIAMLITAAVVAQVWRTMGADSSSETNPQKQA